MDQPISCSVVSKETSPLAKLMLWQLTLKTVPRGVLHLWQSDGTTHRPEEALVLKATRGLSICVALSIVAKCGYYYRNLLVRLARVMAADRCVEESALHVQFIESTRVRPKACPCYPIGD
jgi:hypothetical protein